MEPKKDRTKELFRERGLNGAIVSSPKNLHHVTGFGGHQHTVSRQLGLTLVTMHSDGKAPTHVTIMDFKAVTLCIGSVSLGFVVGPYDTWVGLRAQPEIPQGTALPDKVRVGSSADKLEQFVKAYDLADKQAGARIDYLTVPHYDMIREKFSKTRLVDILDLFVYARGIKTEEETKTFRESCRIAGHGFTQVSRMAGIGVSEKEMSDCFREDIIRPGLCVSNAWSIFSTGLSGARLTLSGDRIMEDEDVVKFGAGVNVEFSFYITDTSRAWIIGNGDPALVRLKDRLYEGQRRMITAARPSLPMSELYHAAYDYVREIFSCYRRGHQGHSISTGPATAEVPYVNIAETKPPETGMALAMEIPYYIDGVNGFNTEDMVLITESGCEVLIPRTPHYL